MTSQTAIPVLAAALLIAPAALAETSAERGAYLVRGLMGCGNCHTPMGPDGFDMGAELGGRLVEENPAFTAYAPNITPAGRVADWSDEDLGRAIREGLRPDGTVIGPPMPVSAYRRISDDDLRAIIAFLRRLPPAATSVPMSEYRMPLPPSYGPSLDTVAAPAPGATVAYGEYLVEGLAHCTECHTPMTEAGPDTSRHGAGGFEFHGPWGTSVSSNLTNHPDGLAEYSDDEIKTMITRGVRPDGKPMMPPMPYGHFAQMSAQDLDAVVLYLRTLPGLPDG